MLSVGEEGKQAATALVIRYLLIGGAATRGSKLAALRWRDHNFMPRLREVFACVGGSYQQQTGVKRPSDAVRSALTKVIASRAASIAQCTQEYEDSRPRAVSGVE